MNAGNKFRTISIYKHYFPEFLAKQRPKVKDKIIWTLKLIEEIQQVPETYLKHLEGTAGLFEIRVQTAMIFLGYFAFLMKGN